MNRAYLMFLTIVVSERCCRIFACIPMSMKLAVFGSRKIGNPVLLQLFRAYFNSIISSPSIRGNRCLILVLPTFDKFFHSFVSPPTNALVELVDRESVFVLKKVCVCFVENRSDERL